MKLTKFVEELQQMNNEQLQEKIDQLRQELFNLRLNALTAHVKDYSQFNKLRKNIARISTMMHQKKN